MNDTLSKNRWGDERPGGQRQSKVIRTQVSALKSLNMEGMAVFLKKVAFTAGRKETPLLSQD